MNINIFNQKVKKGNLFESILDNIEEKVKYSTQTTRKKHRQVIGQKRRLQYYKRLRKEIYEPNKVSFVTLEGVQSSNECKKIWFMWLQGMAQAPAIVQVCKESIQRNLCGDGGWELVLLDEHNFHEYIALPDYIEEKFHRGIIKPALYCDLIRLELLRRYGGLWIDSTVFLSGNRFAKAFDKCDLFMPNGFYFFSGEVMNINCWMIYSKANNPIISQIQRCLYEYWKTYNYELDYFLFHIFAAMVFEDHPDMFDKMPFLCQHSSEYLQMLYHKKVDLVVLDSILNQTEVHKLNYKDVPLKPVEGTYYEWIICQGGMT